VGREFHFDIYTQIHYAVAKTFYDGYASAETSSFAEYWIEVGPSTVPVPGAVWLLGSGLIGLVGFRRKLRKS